MSATWTKRDSEWFEALPDEGPPTHEIEWQPVFRIKLALPPWQDPEDALAALTMFWNAEWEEHYPPDGPVCWITSYENEGSAQSIEAIDPKENSTPDGREDERYPWFEVDRLRKAFRNLWYRHHDLQNHHAKLDYCEHEECVAARTALSADSGRHDGGE